jgi:hypothetical protein
MLRRTLAILLLASFGFIAAADARAAVGSVSSRAERATCCCCELAEAPGAVLAKLCCSLSCGKQGQESPPVPSSGGDPSKLTGLTEQAAALPSTGAPVAANRLSVLIAAIERCELERTQVPLYVTNETFLI